MYRKLICIFMNCFYLFFIGLFFFAFVLPAQEIPLTETGAAEQVYKDAVESENPLPFDNLDVESGYVLYTAELEVGNEASVLALEYVRDYAAVYLDGKFLGAATERNKELPLPVSPGKYVLRLYVENIGRITYGPEITDNSKGLFGSVTLDGKAIENWTIVPLEIKGCDVKSLAFGKESAGGLPSFRKGYFRMEAPRDTYLDVSGWGMGEVWINGAPLGSYWEEEKQQSIRIPAENLLKGENELVVFDLKSAPRKSMKLSDDPVFK